MSFSRIQTKFNYVARMQQRSMKTRFTSALRAEGQRRCPGRHRGAKIELHRSDYAGDMGASYRHTSSILEPDPKAYVVKGYRTPARGTSRRLAGI